MLYTENRKCTILDVKKAYKLANSSLFGFQKWAEDNGINEHLYENAAIPIEESFLYDTFAKKFPAWIRFEQLGSWEDIITLIRKREKNGKI